MLNRLKDVFASFQRHEVKYVVIGGIAAVLHGVPRATFDLDVFIEATEDNAQNRSLRFTLLAVAACAAIAALAALPKCLKALWLFLWHGSIASSAKQVGKAVLKAIPKK